jgi:choline dehydrogenase-like flavoprotein
MGAKESSRTPAKQGTEKDDAAVVDGELRAFGLEWLRVAAASVMPDIVHGHHDHRGRRI